ncbi:chaplin [Streptomyces sp. LaPpAH-108]|uniref:chaplin n=1 Tax=Streptomyces sp. LaPpAH-108 TaxID=1155714 RepID=UPI00035DDA59
MIGVAAASGAMAMAMPVSAAFAAGGASADGAAVGSPGVLSGNTVQLPVSVPVNACGNTVNVVGLLNPAMGNSCANTGADSESDGSGSGSGTSGGSAHAGVGTATSGSSAHSVTHGSPGVLSGNGIQLPVDVPVNACGNSVDVVGVANPAFGNHCQNGPVETTPPPVTPPVTPPPTEPPATPEPPAPPKSHPKPHTPAAPPEGTLAHTGTDATAPALAGSAAFIVAGAALYRRFRPTRVG